MQAGEDLEEDEDEEKEEDEEQIAGTSSLTPAPLRQPEMSESTPLLQTTSKSRSRSRRRRMSIGPHGDATVTQAVLMVRLP
jgi:proton-coupled amino acid transporter